MKETDPQDRNKHGRGPLWLWLLVGAGAVGALLFWLAERFPGVVSGDSENARMVHHLLLVAVLGAALIVRIRARPGTALKHASIWMLIAAILVLGYSYRDHFAAVKERVISELLPSQGRISEDGRAMVFKRSHGGHFVVEALVDGVPVRFLVDTGATHVVLSPDDAKRLGFETDALSYSETYRTANGLGAGAPIRLPEITLGPIVARDVRASVNRAPMGGSLLGMSFLDRLSSFTVEGDTLTLVP